MTTAIAMARQEMTADEPIYLLNVRLAGGTPRTVPAIDGMSVMELLRADGVPIIAECGGAAVCATCHVRVAAQWASILPEPSDEELAKLDDIPDADDASRLACQIVVTAELDGLELDLQADSFRLQQNDRNG
jgi:2Fe-2S ferredoxin